MSRSSDVLAIGREMPKDAFVAALERVIENTQKVVKDLDLLCGLVGNRPVDCRDKLINLFKLCQLDLRGIVSDSLTYRLANAYPTEDARNVSGMLKARLEQLKFALKCAKAA